MAYVLNITWLARPSKIQILNANWNPSNSTIKYFFSNLKTQVWYSDPHCNCGLFLCFFCRREVTLQKAHGRRNRKNQCMVKCKFFDIHQVYYVIKSITSLGQLHPQDFFQVFYPLPSLPQNAADGTGLYFSTFFRHNSIDDHLKTRSSWGLNSKCWNIKPFYNPYILRVCFQMVMNKIAAILFSFWMVGNSDFECHLNTEHKCSDSKWFLTKWRPFCQPFKNGMPFKICKYIQPVVAWFVRASGNNAS